MSVLDLARPEIRALEPYAHASWDPRLERLHANESPWRGEPDRTRAGLNRYPEPHPHEVEVALARLYGVPDEQVLAGRGSDEGIDLLVRGFCAAGRDAIVTCPPTFGMYKVAAQVQGATVREVPLEREHGFALDPARVLAACDERTKIVFTCAPNNPTGNDTDAEVVLSLARALAGKALVVADEAYVEFAERPSLATRLPEHENLVVLRTLSKAHGLAGARCGAVLAHPDVIGLLRRMIPPYSLATGTIESVLDALQPAVLTSARQRMARLVVERGRLVERLAGCEIVRRTWPSAANFLLVESDDAARLVAAAHGAGFLLRDFSRHPLLPGGVRITVGSPEQDDRLVAALERA